MFINILKFGLLVIPFFLWPNFDTRQPKYFLALFISLLLGLYAIHKGILRQYKNIYLLLFFAFIPINFFFSPKVEIMISGVPIGSWIWQSFLFILIFFLGHWAISSFDFKGNDIRQILKTMAIAGIVISSYAVLQFLGFDQFFRNPGQVICGTLGNPGALAPFIAMIIPLAFYLKWSIAAIFMILTVFLINSQVGYGSMVLSLLFLWGTGSEMRRYFALGIVTILVIILGLGFFISPKIKSFISDSGRFEVWGQTFKDIRSPMTLNPGNEASEYSMTGFGLGSFKYIFHTQHPKGDFLEAHNEYLEILYNMGLIGFALFLLAFLWFIKSCFPLGCLQAHLLASFICIAISAGGMFVWQNGATIFYTITIMGLLTWRNNTKTIESTLEGRNNAKTS